MMPLVDPVTVLDLSTKTFELARMASQIARIRLA